MRGKKILLLFLALLLPGCIFLFLKLFGKNRFDVPLLYEDGVHSAPASCNLNYPTPYRLADTIMTAMRAEKRSPLFLVSFSVDKAVLARIQEETGDVVTNANGTSGMFASNPDLFKNCVLLLPPPNDLILIDDQGRIRGYFDSKKLDEADRLILETKIILKQY